MKMSECYDMTGKGILQPSPIIDDKDEECEIKHFWEQEK